MIDVKTIDVKRTARCVAAVVVVVIGAACAAQPAGDKAEVGQDVAVTKADGGVVEGKVTQKDDTTVQVTRGKTTKTIPKADIADVKVIAPRDPADTKPVKPVELPPVAKFREYTVAEGTKLSLKLSTPVSSATSKVEDAVEATLVDAVMVDGAEAVPAGSVVTGYVAAADGAGRVKGLASLTVKFTSLSAHDTKHAIEAAYTETAEATKGTDAKKIGGGAAIGAAIGGLLGGKSGAAKGAAAGGAAGAGVVVATKGKEVEYGAGATISVSLAKGFDVRVPIK
jgi:hypothetical protein